MSEATLMRSSTLVYQGLSLAIGLVTAAWVAAHLDASAMGGWSYVRVNLIHIAFAVVAAAAGVWFVRRQQVLAVGVILAQLAFMLLMFMAY